MKYVKQFMVILCVTAAGELLHALIPVPVPGSVYGLVLMLLCLLTGWIKLSQVEDTAIYLIEIMPFMFLPSTTSLMENWASAKNMLLPLIVISLVTTVLVMVASGKAVDVLLSKKEKTAKEKKDA